MTNPNDPHMPTIEYDNNGGIIQGFGLTKREYFASMALQGIISNQHTGGNGYAYSEQAEWAVEMADALINALNQKSND